MSELKKELEPKLYVAKSRNGSNWIRLAASIVMMALCGNVVASGPFSFAVTSGRFQSQAQNSLAKGIAFFDDGQFPRAQSYLKRALAEGLQEQADAALAYKYLAFYYCKYDVRRLCVDSFRRSMQLNPDLYLNLGERNNKQILSAYEEARNNIKREQIGAIRGMRISADRTARAKFVPKRNMAVLMLDIMPWASVYIDGKLRAVTPPDKRLWLPSGSHKIRVVNRKNDVEEAKYRLAGGEVYVLEYQFE